LVRDRFLLVCRFLNSELEATGVIGITLDISSFFLNKELLFMALTIGNYFGLFMFKPHPHPHPKSHRVLTGCVFTGM